MELVKALTEISSLIARSRSENELFSFLLERTCYETGSDFSVLFYLNKDNSYKPLRASHRDPHEYEIAVDEGLQLFLGECDDYIVSHRGDKGPFPGLLVRARMRSAAAFPLRGGGDRRFLLILNSMDDLYYNQDRLLFLEASCRIAREALDRMAEQK